MEKLLERHKLPKLNQEIDNNLKSHISVKETEYVVKYLSTKKIQGSNGFAGEFYQTFKEKIISTTDSFSKQTTQKTWEGDNTFRFVLLGQTHSEVKNRQNWY